MLYDTIYCIEYPYLVLDTIKFARSKLYFMSETIYCYNRNKQLDVLEQS